MAFFTAFETVLNYLTGTRIIAQSLSVVGFMNFCPPVTITNKF